MKKTIVVGAGMVGLATAWHLQRRGHDVEVLDKHGVAGGASWGNAGWLAPAKTIPLSDPGLWRYGPKALFDPDAALSWELVLRHCPEECHVHPVQQWTGTSSGTFTAPAHESPAHLELSLTATDAGGATATVRTRLDGSPA